MSYPAAKALPLVGVFACADSFLTSNGGEVERGGGGAELSSGGFGAEEEDMYVLGRLGRGDVGKDGGSCDGGGGVGIVYERDKAGDALARSLSGNPNPNLIHACMQLLRPSTRRSNTKVLHCYSAKTSSTNNHFSEAVGIE